VSEHPDPSVEVHPVRRNLTFSIIVPVYNEEEAIGQTIKQVLESRAGIKALNPEISEVECIVVDDGSRDRSREILRGYSEVRVIEHPVNRGYGAALKTGFKHGRGEILGFLDGDGTCSPVAFGEMIRTLLNEDADIVLGSRMINKRTGMPILRRVGNTLYAYLLSWLVDKRVTDTASGMRVFKRSVLPRLSALPNGLDFTPAMSTQALHEKMRVSEIPVPYDERSGPSKLSVAKDGVRFLATILRIARLYNPLKFFGIAGLSLFLFGIVLGIRPMWDYVRFGLVTEGDMVRFFLLMVLIISGINVTHFGAFMNNVLAIMHHREPYRNDIWHKYIFRRAIMTHLDKVGIGLSLLGAVLFGRAIYQQLFLGQITVHWTLILLASTFFLVGVQLFMGTFLIKILQELQVRPGYDDGTNKHG
jgi:glycosyltransferase involved in cell wall biosynthesis